jgi:hypothetical protein
MDNMDSNENVQEVYHHTRNKSFFFAGLVEKINTYRIIGYE